MQNENGVSGKGIPLRICGGSLFIGLSIFYLCWLSACLSPNQNSEKSFGPAVAVTPLTASPLPIPAETPIKPSTSQRATIIPPAAPSKTIPVTRGVENSPQANDASQDPTGMAPGISGNGRWIVFTSRASNLVPNDTNRCVSHWSWSRREENCGDVFARDRMRGRTIRVSVSSEGTEANGESYAPVISEDGQWVAFRSRASNLAPSWEEQCRTRDFPDNCTGVFAHNLQSGRTELIVTMSDAGGEGGSEYLSISANGRYITFWSAESALQPNSHGGAGNFFVYDREHREIEIVQNGRAANSESVLCLPPNSPIQRRWLAYACTTGGVFVLDSQTGKSELVSTSSANVSQDQRYAVFPSNAEGLISNNTQCDHPQFGTQYCYQVYVFDAHSKETELVSRADEGIPGNGDSMNPTFSAQARWVAFASEASNLVTEDTNACAPNSVRFRCADIFLFDRQKKQIARINLSAVGEQANDTSFSPQVSANGEFVIFLSSATNLVPRDTNNVVDVFLYNRLIGEIERVSVP